MTRGLPRFAKWRASAAHLSRGSPSSLCVRREGLRAPLAYAAPVQDEGMVPIVEPRDS